MAKIVKVYSELPRTYLTGWTLLTGLPGTTDRAFIFVPNHQENTIVVLQAPELQVIGVWRMEEVDRWGWGENIPTAVEVLIKGDEPKVFVATQQRLIVGTLRGTPPTELRFWPEWPWENHQLGAGTEIWQLVGANDRVLVSGYSPNPEVLAFVGALRIDGMFQWLARQIDEAAWDVTFDGSQHYLIAAGRAGKVLRGNLAESDLRQELEELEGWAPTGEPAFRPMRIRVVPESGQVIAASYNRLFLLTGNRFAVSYPVCELPDCINDIVVSKEREEVFVACTYSNAVKALDLKDLSRPPRDIVGLERPCWMKLYRDRLYVLGHSNGNLYEILLD